MSLRQTRLSQPPNLSVGLSRDRRAPVHIHEQRVAERRLIYLVRLTKSSPPATAAVQLVEAWYRQVIRFRNLQTDGTAPLGLTGHSLRALSTCRSRLARHLASRGYQSSAVVLAVDDVFIARSETDCPIHGPVIQQQRARRSTPIPIHPTKAKSTASAFRATESTAEYKGYSLSHELLVGTGCEPLPDTYTNTTCSTDKRDSSPKALTAYRKHDAAKSIHVWVRNRTRAARVDATLIPPTAFILLLFASVLLAIAAWWLLSRV
ncbi:hypothetical protein LY78DRAFT_686865 [Colletotrichum sublineola]|nr:hypothetical protein LY78DRAFT_686865 [Colletotrichum sublineola]